MEITEEDWEKTYKPIQNTLVPNASYEGRLFETYGIELDYVREVCRKDPNLVWTLVDGENEMVIAAGLHFVNRLGHFITEVPVPTDVDGLEVILDV